VSDETKWSPEPWRVSASGFLCSATNLVLIDSRGDVPPADLRRIVACVNACAGIPTAALEAGALAKALDALKSAQSVLSAVSAASLVDRSEWSLHKGMAEVVRDRLYDMLRALGRLP
jgi:hypothetical protein